MLTIRPNQEAAFAEDLEKRFRARLAEHLVRCFPDRCLQLGEDGLDREVRYGLERARSHRFAQERELSKYLNLMFVFGRDYDRDPALSWAREILALGCRPSQKMERLYQRAVAEARRDRITAAGSHG